MYTLPPCAVPAKTSPYRVTCRCVAITVYSSSTKRSLPCAVPAAVPPPCTKTERGGPYRARLSDATAHGREGYVPEVYTVSAARLYVWFHGKRLPRVQLWMWPQLPCVVMEQARL